MNSTSFDPFFRRVAHALGIDSQQQLAVLLGVNRSAVTQAKRRDAVPDKWMHILARDYGLRPEWLATGRGAAQQGAQQAHAAPPAPPQPGNYVEVPKVRARLCAGGGSFEVGAEVEEFFVFKQQWLQRKGSPGHMVLMDVFGNSMEPEIKEGDTVLVDQRQNQIMAGSIYAVGVEDTVMIKRLEKRPSALVLLSDNTDYAPVLLQGDELENVRIIGKVVWISREYR